MELLVNCFQEADEETISCCLIQSCIGWFCSESKMKVFIKQQHVSCITNTYISEEEELMWAFLWPSCFK